MPVWEQTKLVSERFSIFLFFFEGVSPSIDIHQPLGTALSYFGFGKQKLGKSTLKKKKNRKALARSWIFATT